MHQAAAEDVSGDSRVREVLGTPVRCSQPVSIASSSSNINGMSTSTTQVSFTAAGPRGYAQVQAVLRNGVRDIAVVRCSVRRAKLRAVFLLIRRAFRAAL